MTLIDEININNVVYKFYSGIDVEIIKKHPKDGTSGFIFFYVESWINEFKSINRQRKLDSMLNETRYKKFIWKELENPFISIYQSEGVGLEEIHSVIKRKILNGTHDSVWTPISSIEKGVWKIG